MNLETIRARTVIAWLQEQGVTGNNLETLALRHNVPFDVDFARLFTDAQKGRRTLKSQIWTIDSIVSRALGIRPKSISALYFNGPDLIWCEFSLPSSRPDPWRPEPAIHAAATFKIDHDITRTTRAWFAAVDQVSLLSAMRSAHDISVSVQAAGTAPGAYDMVTETALSRSLNMLDKLIEVESPWPGVTGEDLVSVMITESILQVQKARPGTLEHLLMYLGLTPEFNLDNVLNIFDLDVQPMVYESEPEPSDPPRIRKLLEQVIRPRKSQNADRRKIDIVAARRLRLAGYSLSQIANEFGVTRQAVHKALNSSH